MGHRQGMRTPHGTNMQDACSTGDRRLRIGYVSPDFRAHPVGWLMEPLLANHDRGQFNVFCYSDVRSPDPQTGVLRRLSGSWRETTGMSDPAFVDAVRSDRIDILIDLSGHFAENRLVAFAAKPAAIQATFLNYPDTTGVPAMDFRLTDDVSDPVGMTEALHVERLVRLTGGPWCYAPPAPTGAISSTLLRSHGSAPIIFCNLNNPAKTSRQSIAAWSQILSRVPGSKMMLLCRSVPANNSYLRDHFVRSGIDVDRLVWVSPRKREDYLEYYRDADVALDPMPFTGGLTTCDALWMGVPVVTLSGVTCSSRRGTAILSALGRREWIADTFEQYVDKAVRLATDPPTLTRIRGSLRREFEVNSMADSRSFALKVEAAFREMVKISKQSKI